MQVVDVTRATRRLMGAADGRAVRSLLTDRAPALRRAVGDALGAVTKKSPVARGVELSEDQVRRVVAFGVI